MKRQTNFDIYLEEQLKDEDFAARFKKAGEAWTLQKGRRSLGRGPATGCFAQRVWIVPERAGPTNGNISTADQPPRIAVI
jgi:hypothetical protein